MASKSLAYWQGFVPGGCGSCGSCQTMWHGAGQLGLDSWGWKVTRCNFLLTYIAYIMRRSIFARSLRCGSCRHFFSRFELLYPILRNFTLPIHCAYTYRNITISIFKRYITTNIANKCIPPMTDAKKHYPKHYLTCHLTHHHIFTLYCNFTESTPCQQNPPSCPPFIAQPVDS